jgi:hypothetical protein
MSQRPSGADGGSQSGASFEPQAANALHYLPCELFFAAVKRSKIGRVQQKGFGSFAILHARRRSVAVTPLGELHKRLAISQRIKRVNILFPSPLWGGVRGGGGSTIQLCYSPISPAVHGGVINARLDSGRGGG